MATRDATVWLVFDDGRLRDTPPSASGQPESSPWTHEVNMSHALTKDASCPGRAVDAMGLGRDAKAALTHAAKLEARGDPSRRDVPSLRRHWRARSATYDAAP